MCARPHPLDHPRTNNIHENIHEAKTHLSRLVPIDISKAVQLGLLAGDERLRPALPMLAQAESVHVSAASWWELTQAMSEPMFLLTHDAQVTKYTELAILF